MILSSELRKIGFSDKEAKVYVALLELGKASVRQIAAKSKVNRATTYVVLEALTKRGIVSTVEENKKTLFIAEGPRTLLRIFRIQEEELKGKWEEFKKALPELEAIFNRSAEKPIVRFFEGKEGLRTMREEILQSGVQVLYDIYALEYVEQLRSLFTDEENEEFRRREAELGISMRSIYAAHPNETFDFRLKGERKRILKEQFPFPADVLIFGNKVAINTLKGKIISIIIESKEIADTMRLIFELAWRGADAVK